MKLEDELENLKLKYSDADIEKILTDVLKNTNYEFIADSLIIEFKNYYISKMERENGRI
jgi:ethanolamine ammonia-lyase large subunit